MRRTTAIDHLLDDLHDTCEIVVRRWTPGCELRDAWRAAHEDAVAAYRAWSASPGSRTAYAVYLAAEDRADAALHALIEAR
ncbi:hypothetical protein [Paraconexibacter sp.]|uniref:hypothetical protein n=1 Tax=Paraconexibacter sp. TaxID=2949640 RepID=UPI00356B120C